MTETEKRDLNRRVALTLGAKAYRVRCVAGHELHGRYYIAFTRQSIGDPEIESWRIQSGQYEPFTEEMLRTHGLERDIPDYCENPAAADMVRQEIERRGWEWTAGSLKNWEVEREGPYWARAHTEPGTDSGRASFAESPHHALCLAFLAACDDQKSTKAEETPV